MKLNDPVAKHLPAAVKMPTRNGAEITLLNLAAQDSGLPFNADNHRGTNWSERFSSYTVPNMYEFLGSYQLTQDPGEKFQYSNIGMGLLGHVMATAAGQDFESLVVDRICRPLGMESTCITLTPELKSRFAVGHDEAWKRAANFELPAIAGAGAVALDRPRLVEVCRRTFGPDRLAADAADEDDARHSLSRRTRAQPVRRSLGHALVRRRDLPTVGIGFARAQWRHGRLQQLCRVRPEAAAWRCRAHQPIRHSFFDARLADLCNVRD